MEKVGEDVKLISKVNVKLPQPIVSTRLPDVFSQARKSRPKTRQQLSVKHDVNKNKQDLQQELNINEQRQKYKQASKMLSPLKMSPSKKSKIERLIMKIRTGLPDFNDQVTDIKTLKTSTVKLHEMITLSVIKSSRGSGAVRKVLHAPTLRIFAIKEVPLQTKEIRIQLRD